MQKAAAEAGAAHPDGIDVLIANAGIATLSQDINTPDIELCAATSRGLCRVLVLLACASMKLIHTGWPPAASSEHSFSSPFLTWCLCFACRRTLHPAPTSGPGRVTRLTGYLTMRRDPKDFDEFFHVNVAGLFATVQAFYPLLKVRLAVLLTAQSDAAACALCFATTVNPLPGCLSHHDHWQTVGRHALRMHAERLSGGPQLESIADELLLDGMQKKQDGRKTVLTMSSAMGIVSQASEASRDPAKPLGVTDGIMLSYKASKTAVTQSAHRSAALCCLIGHSAAASLNNPHLQALFIALLPPQRLSSMQG